MKTDSGRLAKWLDGQLKVGEFDDDSWNGLQVANSGRVGKICFGVDATLDFLEEAAARGAGMVVCHHGISWGTSLARITGLNYRLVAFLVAHDIALYACHLPLDAHPVLGNNAGLARLLGLRRRRSFAAYHGRHIGICGELPRATAFAALLKQVQRLVNREAAGHDFGPPKVKRVGVVSGGAAMSVGEAAAAGLDTYITGEPSLPGFHLARQQGINVIYAGHYATEVFGVQSLQRLVGREFGISGEFLDLAAPY